MASVSAPTSLLIADISGYTSYLAGVELDHAQDILADLMATVVTALRPTFRLAKLEGDAAFTFAATDKLDGSLLLDTIERCYFGFRRRRRDVRQATSCECNACSRIPDLNLKFVSHAGTVARQKVFGLDELVGADVIVVHRLLKNHIVESTGIEAYAYFSQAIVDAMSLQPEALGMVPHAEAYEVLGDVPGWVDDLERRWREEDSRARVLVRSEEAVLEASYEAPAPPQVVWEFLTAPGRRVQWSVGVTDVIQDAAGNRRGVGTTNHCMHGKDAIVEEVLDWRPFDYYTLRSAMPTPVGPVTLVNSTELEPTASGSTIVHMRFGGPKSVRERALLVPLTPMFEGMIAASSAALQAMLRTEVLERQSDAPAEPPLPEPRSDGVLAELAPST